MEFAVYMTLQSIYWNFNGLQSCTGSTPIIVRQPPPPPPSNPYTSHVGCTPVMGGSLCCICSAATISDRLLAALTET